MGGVGKNRTDTSTTEWINLTGSEYPGIERERAFTVDVNAGFIWRELNFRSNILVNDQFNITVIVNRFAISDMSHNLRIICNCNSLHNIHSKCMHFNWNFRNPFGHNIAVS